MRASNKHNNYGLILAFLFFKSVTITQTPVDISNKWMEIKLESPLTAANTGATIYIDVTSIVKDNEDVDYLDKKFPANTIQAILVDTKGKEVMFVNGSSYSFGKNVATVKMIAKEEISTKSKYKVLKIRSHNLLKNVKISWKNYDM